MASAHEFTRRTFVSLIAAAPLARAAATEKIPVGLEMYTVRDEMKKDLTGTVEAVAKMGYDCVEFFAPYSDWSADQAKQIRSLMDQLKIRCYSTHNSRQAFSGEALDKAIQLNKILGSKYIVMASPGQVKTLDDWKRLAETLNSGNKKMHGYGLQAGYHNHVNEWKELNGKRPMDVLADNTDETVMLQLDVGHCVAGGGDPVNWIDSHPGRTRSLHLKDWSPQKEFNVLIGQGTVPWKQLFTAAESKGKVEFYLIEQEGNELPELEAADRSLIAYKDLRSNERG
ncbi:MAG: sugar phosphate isomerase/epimerase [Acidobacteriaceae bacterium]|nr:sugar phosphate isomerase/epimerase [Acidobacteriaceae bacterium]